MGDSTSVQPLFHHHDHVVPCVYESDNDLCVTVRRDKLAKGGFVKQTPILPRHVSLNGLAEDLGRFSVLGRLIFNMDLVHHHCLIFRIMEMGSKRCLIMLN